LLQARARLEMREKASQQDAQDVVEIMKYSLLDTFSDDFGNLDFQRSQHGSGMSSRAQVRIFPFTKFFLIAVEQPQNQPQDVTTFWIITWCHQAWENISGSKLSAVNV